MPDSSWVRVGRLLRTRGKSGEFIAEIDSAKPGRAELLRRVLLRLGAREASFEVAHFWRHDGRPVFQFTGIDSISQAEPWEGAELLVPAEDRVPLEPGEYYQADLVGCAVEDRGSVLGTVTQVEETSGPLLLHVETPDGRQLLIPFAQSICREIDVSAKRIRVELPEGLAEL